MRWACVYAPGSNQALIPTLQNFSPEVEASTKESGVFWLNASGLNAVYPSLPLWTSNLHHQLKKSVSQCSIVVGFSRFASYAIAKHHKTKALYVDSYAHEQNLLLNVPIACLAVDPKQLDALSKLGIYSLNEFAHLPSHALRKRFDTELWQLHQQLTDCLKPAGQTILPLQAAAISEPICEKFELAYPDTNVATLLFALKRVLNVLLDKLGTQQAIHRLDLILHCENRCHQKLYVRPADATLDAAQLLQLLHLKLLNIELVEPVIELQLTAQTVRMTAEQLLLFAHKPKRDLAAANRALARIRAEHGDHIIKIAELRSAHLPEAQYRWLPLQHLKSANVEPPRSLQLIRRLYLQPLPADNAQYVQPLKFGPYTLAGGWWKRSSWRDYYFVEDRWGGWKWVFFDHKRKRWFLHGEVQ